MSATVRFTVEGGSYQQLANKEMCTKPSKLRRSTDPQYRGGAAENARLENAVPNCRTEKREDGKVMEKRSSLNSRHP